VDIQGGGQDADGQSDPRAGAPVVSSDPKPPETRENDCGNEKGVVKNTTGNDHGRSAPWRQTGKSGLNPCISEIQGLS
jgi:hypothetical protein